MYEVSCVTHSSYSSGSADIDTVRHEVELSQSKADDYRRRSLLLYMWLSALQQQGADTRLFTSVDERYYQLEGRIEAATDKNLVLELAALIDEGFGVMEEIQSRLPELGPIATPSEGDAADFPPGGDMDAEWPMFQGNIHHTGYTEAPAPRCFPRFIALALRPPRSSGGIQTAAVYQRPL